MPIRSLLSQTSFNPDQTEMIAKAFDDAWAELGDEAEPALAHSFVNRHQAGGPSLTPASEPPR